MASLEVAKYALAQCLTSPSNIWRHLVMLIVDPSAYKDIRLCSSVELTAEVCLNRLSLIVKRSAHCRPDIKVIRYVSSVALSAL